MPNSSRFDLVLAPEVIDHLDAIERRFHGLIGNTIDEQLTFSPATQTRNRKPLEQPAPYGAAWELRFGPRNRFRVFYEIDDAQRIVSILAIGDKEGSRLFIGGEEWES